MKEKIIKMTFDVLVNAGYIYISQGKIEKTEPLVTEDGLMINIDKDENDKIIGIEIIGSERNFDPGDYTTNIDINDKNTP